MIIWNSIKHNYNLENSFSYFDGEYEFVNGNGRLFLVCCVENVNLFNKILPFFNNSVFFYKVVNNNFGSKITCYNGSYYILVEYEIRSENIYYLIRNYDIFNTAIKGECRWRDSWIDRCELIERYYGYVVGEYDFIDESIDYYYGMLELAIYYLRDFEYDECLYIQHRYYQFDKVSFYNPGCVKLDIKERDFSNYLKKLFFSGTYRETNILDIINENIDRYNFDFVIARLIYPDYYFDLFDKIVCDNSKFESDVSSDKYKIKLCDIVSKVYDYEKYIISIYELVSLKKDIKKVDFFNLH